MWVASAEVLLDVTDAPECDTLVAGVMPQRIELVKGTGDRLSFRLVSTALLGVTGGWWVVVTIVIVFVAVVVIITVGGQSRGFAFALQNLSRPS